MSESDSKSENDDEIESNGESENVEVSADKEKGFGSQTLQTHKPFIEYYENQVKTGQRQPGFYWYWTVNFIVFLAFFMLWVCTCIIC